MDPRLYQALGARAKARNRSISHEVIHMIQSHLSDTHPDQARADDAFLRLTGAWQDKRSAAQIASSIRSSRKNRTPSKHVFD
ncbi:hypothetical protein [Geitlerinema calcuttense]|uniref:Arc-like DNA binding domain-containing protein n=1 Tax=Geitlerinema calcuttense NRMC-F 0142 TaxID=2922238 RepID=A0ABT7LX68_9CYAN|nr:hypothetical protein [Geitlerinema calcuttense]MDL5056604.1 hypothetical protein [Geitlerinema calcuttense NRMC-F 0142]